LDTQENTKSSKNSLNIKFKWIFCEISMKKKEKRIQTVAWKDK
jgi:hypothetical protein